MPALCMAVAAVTSLSNSTRAHLALLLMHGVCPGDRCTCLFHLLSPHRHTYTHPRGRPLPCVCPLRLVSCASKSPLATVFVLHVPLSPPPTHTAPQCPSPEQLYIAGLLDPAANSKLEPNIPAELLYDKKDDGLNPANSWKGYYVILNPDFRSGVPQHGSLGEYSSRTTIGDAMAVPYTVWP